MQRIYRNPEAKTCLIQLITLFLCIGVIGTILIHMINTSYIHDIKQQSANILAITKIDPIQLETYLSSHIVSDAIKNEAQTLSNLDIIPNTNLTLMPYSIIIFWVALIVIFLIIFIAMTRHFKSLYQLIYDLTEFSYSIQSQEQPLDIRNTDEGDIASFKNELYAMGHHLQTQLSLEIKQKEYLSKHIADISHQLKTPLTSLVLVIDSLRLNDISHRTDEQLDLLEPQIHRIEHLIQSLLMLTRLDANATKFSLSAVPSQQFIEAIIEKLIILANQKQVTVTLINENKPILHIDHFLMFEAISNVVKNAIEHAFINSTVTINISENIFYTLITVHNKGHHILTEDLPHLFQRFYRGKTADKNGVGIGLSLAYEITIKHKGKLTAENVSDGVLFTFSIPK